MSRASHAEAFEAAGGQGLTTGFPVLDSHLDVIVRGELCLIGGPAFGGKSTLALNIALNNSLEGVKTFWCSPDESHGFVVRKLIGAHFDVKLRDINEWHKRHRRDAMEFLEHMETWFFCSEESGLDEIAKDMVEANAQWGVPPELFVFDYVRLLDSGWSSIRENLSWLKRLAKSSDMHVLAIHQSNKSALDITYDRNGHPLPPSMSDLNEAGHAEAFQVLWVRRPPPLDEADALRAQQYPRTEIHILKNKLQAELPGHPITLAVSRGGRLIEQ